MVLAWDLLERRELPEETLKCFLCNKRKEEQRPNTEQSCESQRQFSIIYHWARPRFTLGSSLVLDSKAILLIKSVQTFCGEWRLKDTVSRYMQHSKVIVRLSKRVNDCQTVWESRTCSLARTSAVMSAPPSALLGIVLSSLQPACRHKVHKVLVLKIAASANPGHNAPCEASRNRRGTGNFLSWRKNRGGVSHGAWIQRV